MPPSKALHTDLLGGDSGRLKDAVNSLDPPMVIVVPHAMPVPETITLLKEAGLWFVTTDSSPSR